MNCGDYEISEGALGSAIGAFHKDQISQTGGNKSLVKE